MSLYRLSRQADADLDDMADYVAAGREGEPSHRQALARAIDGNSAIIGAWSFSTNREKNRCSETRLTSKNADSSQRMNCEPTRASGLQSAVTVRRPTSDRRVRRRFGLSDPRPRSRCPINWPTSNFTSSQKFDFETAI